MVDLSEHGAITRVFYAEANEYFISDNEDAAITQGGVRAIVLQESGQWVEIEHHDGTTSLLPMHLIHEIFCGKA